MRFTISVPSIASLAFLAATLSAQTCNEKLIGTWSGESTDVSSKKKTDNPNTKETFRQTFKRKGDGVESTVNNGKPIFFRCDGKDYPRSDQSDTAADTWNIQEKGDTGILTFKKHGKVTLTRICELSADGREMHCISKAPNGQELDRSSSVKTN
jgi:hypothetical protein